MIKIAYLGIDFLSPVLVQLLKEDCQILQIFTCPTDNVTEFNISIIETAKARKIPYTQEKITKNDLKRLKEEGCELLVCAGYYYRIPVTDAFCMVNFHPSPLPIGRGAWPMPVIILNQMPVGGITAHKIEKTLDTGDILLQETFSIDKKETLETYMEKVYKFLPDMVHRLVHEFRTLWNQAKPQGDGTYWSCPTEKDWTITPDMDVEQADRILRAFYGYECIYQTPEKRVEMIEAKAVSVRKQELLQTLSQELLQNLSQNLQEDSMTNLTNYEFPVKGGYLIAKRRREL